MTIEKKAIWQIIFSFVISIAICIGIIYLVKGVFTTATDFLIKIIPFIGAILVAVINNHFQRINDKASDERKKAMQIESEERSKKMQIESEERIKITEIKKFNKENKQENYSDLVNLITSYIRQESANNDTLATIHMKSWVYGSADVIKNTSELIKANRNMEYSTITPKLRSLLISIRKDIGDLDTVDDSTELINLLPEIKLKQPGNTGN